MKKSKVIKENQMKLILTLNNLKFLFLKWDYFINLILFVILIYVNFNFTIQTVYAMEHIHLWKNGIYYTNGQFDSKLLRSFIFYNYNMEVPHSNLIKILDKKKLIGLFNKPHIFLIYNNIEVLSSLIHSNGIENIPQYLGEPFDYIKNKIFLIQILKQRMNINYLNIY